MPDETRAVTLIIVAIIGVFLVLTGIVIYILSFYHKRRIEHQQQIAKLQQDFKETLLTSQLEIQENNFRHISQEIHDSVGQQLTLVKIQLNLIGQSENITRQMIEGVKENVSGVMTELRDIAKGLNTDRIQVSNLYEMIELEVDRINRNTHMKGTASLSGVDKDLDKHKKLILFRIVQECLQNIIKHSKAKTFRICLRYLENGLQVSVEDDGAGFDTAGQQHKHKGMGLANIQTRSAQIGGVASITSKLKEGTTISIMIPYE